MEQLKQYFQDKTVGQLLDIGTGSGNFIKVLKESIPDAKITGIDPDLKALEEAKGIYPESSFVEMTGEQLNFEDNSFDVASISMALHHLPDVEKTLSEMQRVVKKGGWIIVNELFSDNLSPAQEVHKIYHHFRSTIDRLIGISHNPTFTRKDIITRIREAGIDIQMMFDYQKANNLIENQNDMEERIDKMEEMLEKIADKPEYHELRSEIENFKILARQHGFEIAKRIVIVGQVK